MYDREAVWRIENCGLKANLCIFVSYVVIKVSFMHRYWE